MASQSSSAPKPSQHQELRSAQLVAGLFWFLSFVVPPAPGPSPGFSTGMAAAMGWVIWLLATGEAALPWRRVQPRALLLGAVCFVALIASAAWRAHWVDAAVLALALLVFVKAGLLPLGGWQVVLARAIVAGALVNAVMAMVQALFPAELPGLSPWLASNANTPGRAGGNLGQPNQLAMLLVLALLVVWTQWGQQRFKLQAGLSLALGMALAWTGSRTGLVCLACLSAWLLMAKPQQRRAGNRGLFAAAWSGVLLGGGLQWLMGHFGKTVFFASQRMQGGSDLSSSRWGIWADSLALLKQHPLTGVGWGELNFAWTFSDLPERGHALLGHAHNLFLHWAVELGLPLAMLLTLGFAALFWLAARHTLHSSTEGRLTSQSVLLGLGLLMLHSQLEYPLWYLYFLMPAAFWLGALLKPAVEQAPSDVDTGQRAEAVLGGLRQLGVLAMFICLYALYDYSRVVQVYAPFGPAKNQAIELRVQRARSGLFYGHYGDLAYVFTNQAPSLNDDDFKRPLHHLINPALLKSYAEYLNAHGQLQDARQVARMLRKYHHAPVVQAFFSACEHEPSGQAARPFQCDL